MATPDWVSDVVSASDDAHWEPESDPRLSSRLLRKHTHAQAASKVFHKSHHSPVDFQKTKYFMRGKYTQILFDNVGPKSVTMNQETARGM